MKTPAQPKQCQVSFDSGDLRHRAELRLNANRKNQVQSLSKEDTRRQFHELEVHQIELEMQNAELKNTRDELEILLENYTDLYDFAPVGYFTLSADGAIQQVNLTGSILVGIERSRLVGRSFGMLLEASLRAPFACFLNQVFEGEANQCCEFELLTQGRPNRTVNIEARRLLNREECRAVVVDITAHKKAEDQMRVSEIRYRRLFEAANDGILLLDPSTRKITDANPFMTELLDYPHEELVGKELFEIGLIKDESASQEMFRKLKKSHEVRYEDLPLESRAGRHQEVEVVANLYQENDHSVIQCNIRDITERKQAEVASERLAAIVQSSDDAIIGKDLNGIITNWNKGAEIIFGYKASEMVGSSITRLIPSDRPEEENKILGRIRLGKSVEHFETVRQTKDGRLIDVSVTASPIRESNGKVIGVSKVARDITERKQAEEILRRNEALFSALVAQAPMGVYVVDSKLRLHQVNPKAMPIFTQVDPLIGRDFSEIIDIIWSSSVASRIVKLFRRTLKTGKPYQSPGFAERRRDTGVREYYEWQIQRVTLPAGEYGVVCFFDNITERKRAEAVQRRLDVLTASNQKLNQEIIRREAVEKSLKLSEQLQSRLLAQSRTMQEELRHLSREVLHAQEEERKRISRELHDVIAQTLTGINIRLSNLKKAAGLSTRDFERNIASTQKLVENSVNLVHQFARELRPAVLDDLGLIPALHTLMKNFTTSTGVRASLTAFAAVEQLNASKRTVLFRVAQEALSNVSRHSEATRVEVSIHKIPGFVTMKIKDDGKSFNVERTLHAKGAKRLGMLGMRERLEMIKGSFRVESTPGSGTTVEARIPLGRARAADIVPSIKPVKNRSQP